MEGGRYFFHSIIVACTKVKNLWYILSVYMFMSYIFDPYIRGNLKRGPLKYIVPA